MRSAFIIETGPHNHGGYVPGLLGCATIGDTIEEVKRNMAGSIALHLEGMREDGDPLLEPTSLCDYVEVTG